MDQPASEQITCPKCQESIPANSRFCLKCAHPIAADAQPEAGWGVIWRDVAFPGWGHYYCGWRKTALAIAGIVLLGITMGALIEAQATMSAFTQAMDSGNLDVAELTRQAARKSGGASWYYALAFLAWGGALVHGIVMKFQAHQGKNP